MKVTNDDAIEMFPHCSPKTPSVAHTHVSKTKNAPCTIPVETVVDESPCVTVTHDDAMELFPNCSDDASTRDCGLSKTTDSSTVTDGMRYHEPVHDIGANQQNFIDTTDSVEPASKRMATNMVSE